MEPALHYTMLLYINAIIMIIKVNIKCGEEWEVGHMTFTFTMTSPEKQSGIPGRQPKGGLKVLMKSTLKGSAIKPNLTLGGGDLTLTSQ